MHRVLPAVYSASMAQTPYVRFTWGGAIAGSEQWACGLSFSTAATPSAADLNTWLGLMNVPLATYWASGSGPASIASTDTVLQSMRAAFYPANATHATVTAAKAVTTALVGIGANNNPLQLALVISCHTGLAGKRFNGRFYLPFTGRTTTPAVMPNHQLVQAEVTQMALSTAAWMTSSAAVLLAGSGTAPSVAVPGAAVPASPITSVTVDSIIDTQRRRRNKVQPLFSGVHSVP